MGFMDGNVVLDRDVVNPRNNNNRKPNKRNNDNNNKNRKKSRRYENNDLVFRRSSYLPDDIRDEYFDDDSHEEIVHDSRVETINDFCDTFADNTQNFKRLQDIVADEFPDVIGYIKAYYSTKNKPAFIDALNKLIKTMCTTPFMNAINLVLESRIWSEDDTYDRIWTSIAFGLSVALETSHDRMHSDVIVKYATVILPRMWRPEITETSIQTGVSKDLSLDLFIAIPIADNEWTGAMVDAFYHRFLDKMLIHAEDNMDVLNWEVQGMLYDRMFGKSKIALKVIGKYLVSEPVVISSGSEVEEAVYTDFKKMLYSKLDRYDIKDIEYVFGFVAKFIKDNPDKDITFDSATASSYENVRKGLLSVMDKDPETMKYFA